MRYTRSLIIFALLPALVLSGCSRKFGQLLVPGVGDPSPRPDRATSQNPAAFSAADKAEIQEVLASIDPDAPENITIPGMTFLLKSNNLTMTRKSILAHGGRIDYDPNDSAFDDIPYLVATLSVKLLADDEFIQSLDLEALKLDEVLELQQSSEAAGVGLDGVPTNEIGLDGFPGKKGAASAVVGILDTGVDVFHPALRGRVIGVYDGTEVGDFSLQKVEVSEGKLVGHKIELIGEIASEVISEGVYLGFIQEKELGSQQLESARGQGFDLDGNGSADNQWAVLVFKKDGRWVFAVDKKRQDTIDTREVIQDFNVDPSSLLVLNRRHQFPLRLKINSDGVPVGGNVFFDTNRHGTHVAGIAVGSYRGDGVSIVGPAHQAKIVAAKACSQWSCTTSAMLRGIIGFYTQVPVKPDVVNISIGSVETSETEFYTTLFKDLSSKFGTVFVLSAGNRGPGHRNVNSLAVDTPTIVVGAHVSGQMYRKMYPGAENLEGQFVFPFSSGGPSITGELKPHVVAPGAALASIPMGIAGGAAVLNGTSMSAPMVTGAVAMLISQARDEAWFDSMLTASGSNTRVPLIIRNALQNTAKPLPEVPLLRQGSGLIQVTSAMEEFRRLRDQPFFEVQMVQGLKEAFMYERGLVPQRAHVVVLEKSKDPRRTAEQEIQIDGKPLQVRLASIDWYGSDGESENLTDQMIMGIVESGTGKIVKSAPVLLGSATQPVIALHRNLPKMNLPGTYVASYQVVFAGEVMYRFVDVLHRPVDLSLNLFDQSQRFESGARSVAAGQFHSYFIPVSAGDRVLDIHLKGVGPGRTQINVYAPDGTDMGTGLVSRMVSRPTDTESTTLRVPTEGKVGLFEVIVGQGSVWWIGANQYELSLGIERMQTTPIDAVSGILGVTQLVEGSTLMARAGRWQEVVSIGSVPSVPGKKTFFNFRVPRSGVVGVRLQENDLVWTRLGQTMFRIGEAGATVGAIDNLPSPPPRASLKYFNLSEGLLYRGYLETFLATPGAKLTANVELLVPAGSARIAQVGREGQSFLFKLDPPEKDLGMADVEIFFETSKAKEAPRLVLKRVVRFEKGKFSIIEE